MMGKYLTEIPEITITDEMIEQMKNIPFSPEFWDKIAKSIKEENEHYERLCRRIQIDPISGKSTMSWEHRNRMFTL